MYFNKKLLKGIPKEQHKDAKLLLCCFQIDYAVNNAITHNPSGNVHWTKDYLGTVQELILALKRSGAIRQHYKESSRWSLNYPLYVNEEVRLEEDYVKEILSYFHPNYCGQPSRSATVQDASKELEDFIEVYGHKEIIPEVCKYYIGLNEMPLAIKKFINSKNDAEWRGKDLNTYIQLYEGERTNTGTRLR